MVLRGEAHHDIHVVVHHVDAIPRQLPAAPPVTQQGDQGAPARPPLQALRILGLFAGCLVFVFSGDSPQRTIDKYTKRHLNGEGPFGLSFATRMHAVSEKNNLWKRHKCNKALVFWACQNDAFVASGHASDFEGRPYPEVRNYKGVYSKTFVYRIWVWIVASEQIGIQLTWPATRGHHKRLILESPNFLGGELLTSVIPRRGLTPKPQGEKQHPREARKSRKPSGAFKTNWALAEVCFRTRSGFPLGRI